ncbi:glycine cleavage system H protein, mitochondrial-like protein [Sarcoptes scabiei]|uniref:Glycine cleavage system H protein, mitochondrial n=1 Tax=Sarcoptes scabiei TaxID=52283 RepID=A0A132A2P2_SARSC|nr:glycine cleavage system H protein, mitochondrial-like protein [Sarcoptes scabiei]
MNSSTKTVSTLSNKLIQMMNDDEIMKRKLMIDGDGCGDDRKISNLIKQFLLWCYNDNETELECQLSAERLLNAIDQSELAMAKSVETIKMITNELDNYENIYKNIEKSINDAKSKLQSCKAELAYAKQIRRYKLEYDSISNIIEKHPSTQETQIKLNALDEQIQNLQKINNQIESKLEKRRRQFQLLLSTSHQLQSINFRLVANDYQLNKTLNEEFFEIFCVKDYRFSEKHEWIVLDKSDKTIGTVGISQYAQEALGDVVYVQLPEIDSDFDQDDEVGAIESVKAANEIYTPVSGKIIELNENLSEKPNLVNTSCYEEGWLFKIKLKNSEEYEKLMDQKTYDEFLKQSAA